MYPSPRFTHWFVPGSSRRHWARTGPAALGDAVNTTPPGWQYQPSAGDTVPPSGAAHAPGTGAGGSVSMKVSKSMVGQKLVSGGAARSSKYGESRKLYAIRAHSFRARSESLLPLLLGSAH